MAKFNPEDFKAPEMKPLSDVTVNGKVVEWDKIKDGVVAPFGIGNIRLVDGKATYSRPKGVFGEGEHTIDLEVIDGNIDIDSSKIKIAMPVAEMPEANPDYNGDDVDILSMPMGRTERANMVGGHVPQDKVEFKLSSADQVQVLEQDSEGKATITEIDPAIFEEPIKEGFAIELKEASFFRECSCKSCGAPINFYRITAKEYAEARCKGRVPNNFTDEELESLFGDVGEIDGVIYDDSRLCSQCRAYEC